MFVGFNVNTVVFGCYSCYIITTLVSSSCSLSVTCKRTMHHMWRVLYTHIYSKENMYAHKQQNGVECKERKMSMRVYILWHQHIERKSKAWIKFSFLFFCWIVQVLLVVIVEEREMRNRMDNCQRKRRIFTIRLTSHLLLSLSISIA